MAMQSDKIQYEILEDGTISIVTDEVSGVNHRSADELLKELFETVGGEVTSRKRTKLEVSKSLQGALAAHTHDGHTHTH